MIKLLEDGDGAQERLWRMLRDRGESYTRGTWQSRQAAIQTREAGPVVVMHDVSDDVAMEQEVLKPDLPWAEDHFAERVGYVPLNPAPSFLHWPWHAGSHAHDHVSGGVFDHTYPERFWPKLAGEMQTELINRGIRYPYGDLESVVRMLLDEPFTRQAYLPVWFPEDTGATQGQRVPCSIGYHFIRDREKMDVHYVLRSCDLTRHFKNDLYLTARLLQWVCGRLRPSAPEEPWPVPGRIYMTINNLHVFEPDFWRYES